MVDPSISGSSSSPLLYSIHLFRLAKLNSEIKYVANSINRDTPRYAYPVIINILDWQQGMLRQLDQWTSDIPLSTDASPNTHHMTLLCRLRGHSIRTLLLRPSPAIPKPTAEALGSCYDSARQSIRIFDELYRKDLLVHSWTTFHSLVLSTLTMLYCLKAAPTLNTGSDAIMADLSAGLSVLSATGEHWSGAKRCRDILDDLGRSTIQKLTETRPWQPRSDVSARSPSGHLPAPVPIENSVSHGTIGSANTMLDLFNPFDDLLTGRETITENFEDEFVDMDLIMRDLFQDFIPTGAQFT